MTPSHRVAESVTLLGNPIVPCIVHLLIRPLHNNPNDHFVDILYMKEAARLFDLMPRQRRRRCDDQTYIPMDNCTKAIMRS